MNGAMTEQPTNWIGPAVIVAAGLILAPLIWFGLTFLFPSDSFEGSGVDSAARIDLEILRQQVDDLQTRVSSLENQVARLPLGGARQGLRANPDGEDEVLRGVGPNEILNAYAQVVEIADRRNVNKGLKVATPAYLEEKLGRPRDVLSDTCQPMTNERLLAKLVTADVGPIRVQMLSPAIESLRRVFDNVRRADPDLYARIATAGSLCVRAIRGTQNRTSTHSFGLAVDLNIDGRLDTLGDGRTQLGLTILADFFNTEGWVWGAGFGREDSMHFEISRRQLDEWLAVGEL